MKKLIVFDLDGTLAQSKAPLDKEMARLLSNLLNVARVAVISGGAWPQFKKQVISKLPKSSKFDRLSILPTCGTRFYEYDKSKWKKLYAEDFTDTQKKKIIRSINKAVDKAGFKVDKIWGEQIEDRGSQITYSALGQKAPLDPKKAWDPKFAKRKKIKAILDKLIPEFQVMLGGVTSIDVTKHGIDKAYGMHKLQDILEIGIDEMLFVGDALFKGGNDYPASTTGADCIQVRDPEDTKTLIKTVIVCLTAAEKQGTQGN